MVCIGREVGTQYVGGTSQKILTKSLRQIKRDGLVTRTVHSVIPRGSSIS